LREMISGRTLLVRKAPLDHSRPLQFFCSSFSARMKSMPGSAIGKKDAPQLIVGCARRPEALRYWPTVSARPLGHRHSSSRGMIWLIAPLPLLIANALFHQDRLDGYRKPCRWVASEAPAVRGPQRHSSSSRTATLQTACGSLVLLVSICMSGLGDGSPILVNVFTSRWVNGPACPRTVRVVSIT
jgi:hypothetical protein